MARSRKSGGSHEIVAVLAVARSPELFQEKENLVEILLAQVREYDVYAEAGCCKWAYDHEDIARTLRWLEE